MSLADKAMVVTLSVSCWTARKQDKKVAEEVELKHNARDAGRYNKLLIDKQHLDPLTSMAGRIRQKHYDLTLPWLDNGGRLLPSKLFSKYQQEIGQLKDEYRQKVDSFIPLYDSHLIADARSRLGTMYEPGDYPPGATLRRKFSVDIDIIAVPQASDFRVEVGDTERRRIQEEITERMELRQREAMLDAWARVRRVVSTIHARMSAPKTIIHDSLIDNAQELVQLLPGLNIIDDPMLAEVTHDITNNLLVDVWKLRKSATTRKALAKAAEEILKKLPSEPDSTH